MLFSNRSKLLEIQRGDRGRVQGAYNINADSYLSDGHYSRVLFQFREPVLHAEQLHAGAAARCLIRYKEIRLKLDYISAGV